MTKEKFSANGISVKVTDIGMVEVQDLFCNKIFTLYPEEALELCNQIGVALKPTNQTPVNEETKLVNEQ
jgi:hypothetical protein